MPQTIRSTASSTLGLFQYLGKMRLVITRSISHLNNNFQLLVLKQMFTINQSY